MERRMMMGWCICRKRRGERGDEGGGIRGTCMETGGNTIPDVSMDLQTHFAALG